MSSDGKRRGVIPVAWHRLSGLRAPRGVIGIRTVMPRTEADRVHRRLAGAAFPSLARPLALSLQGFLWLRWISFEAWRSAFALWRYRRRRNAAAGYAEISRSLWRALVYGIPPGNARVLGVDDTGVDEVLSFVFESEAAAFHHLRSQRHGDPASASAVLGDKAATCRRLRAAGLGAPEVLAVWGPDDEVSIESLAAHSDGVVFKPNFGSGGRDVLCVLPRHPEAARDQYNRPVEGSATAAVKALQRRGDVILAQPYIPTHLDLRWLGECAHQALIARVITVRGDDGPSVLHAWVEIPGGTTGHNMALIDGSGRIGEPLPRRDGRVTPETAGACIPDWQRLVSDVCAGHALDICDGLHSVAWDVAIGPDGPQILEGNSGWGLVIPQRLFGPMLGNLAEELRSLD